MISSKSLLYCARALECRGLDDLISMYGLIWDRVSSQCYLY